MKDSLKNLPARERRRLFIEATQAIKAGRRVNYKTIAAQIQKEVKQMDYQRMKNIRSDILQVAPSGEELETLYRLYPDECAHIFPSAPPKSEIERLSDRVDKLEKEIDRIKSKTEMNEEERLILIRKMAKLALELEKGRSKSKGKNND